MTSITNEKWLRRALILLGVAALAAVKSIGHQPAETIFGVLAALCLCILLIRFVWVICHYRRIAIRLAHEDRKKRELRERFYKILWIVWFSALISIGRPITWEFGIIYGVAALLIVWHLVPRNKK